MQTEIEKLRQIIAASNNIVFFGGAGVSTESGIPDFRGTDGLYSQKYKYPPEMMLSHSFFMSNPTDFYDLYKNKMLFLDAKPNKAHIWLAEMEKKGKLKAVITQNVDGLHQKAGSKNVLELHGSVYRNYCLECGKLYDVAAVIGDAPVPFCECGGLIRPDVVLYEESLDSAIFRQAKQYIDSADVLLIGGTSLGVYPAAGLITCYRGDKMIIINKSRTQANGRADLVVYGSIGEILSGLIF
jgi:NAD-dependent deacetylase